MGLLDKFRSKKSEHKTDNNYTELNMSDFKALFYKTAKMMQLKINELSIVDILSIQSFICAILERKSDYVSANTVCRIDTAIYTCFKIYTYCFSQIKSEYLKKNFATEILLDYVIAISKYFHLSHQQATKLIQNRFAIYYKVFNFDDDSNAELLCEYKKIILKDINLTEPCLFDDDTPLVISGVDNDFMCQAEIASYNKLLTSVCNDLVFEVIEQYNNVI